MADKKKNKRKFDEDDKPTKEEYAVAKFLRFNVPTKEAKLHSMEVHCFYASAAVDALLESKWSASKNAKDCLFFNRSSCINYCQRLIEKGLFHRAERVQRKKDKDKGDRSKKKKIKDTVEKEDGGTGDELRERKSKKEKTEEEDNKKTAEGEEAKEKKTEENKEEKKDEKKKKEKPIKLVMTDDQRFLDGEENIYVWIYDPVNAKTLFIGSLIVFGAAGLCLFPLWPECVRIGVYYVSLTGAGFVGFILSLVVVRFILFCTIWLMTLGRHHFWLLPNLTEDVGFFESFKPLYKHDVVIREPSSAKKKGKSKSASIKKSKEKAKKSKDKTSDGDNSESEQEFEMVHRGDVEEEEEPGERMEGEEEESEENGEEREEMEEEYGAEEDEDYDDEEEDGLNDGLEEDYEEQEEEEREEDEEEDSELKKDK